MKSSAWSSSNGRAATGTVTASYVKVISSIMSTSVPWFQKKTYWNGTLRMDGSRCVSSSASQCPRNLFPISTKAPMFQTCYSALRIRNLRSGWLGNWPGLPERRAWQRLRGATSSGLRNDGYRDTFEVSYTSRQIILFKVSRFRLFQSIYRSLVHYFYSKSAILPLHLTYCAILALLSFHYTGTFSDQPSLAC